MSSAKKHSSNFIMTTKHRDIKQPATSVLSAESTGSLAVIAMRFLSMRRHTVCVGCLGYLKIGRIILTRHLGKP